MDDRVKAIAPTYPYRNRQLHHEGKGWFQLTLDLRTGYVSKVAVVKSTGFKALDESAVAAFLQWRWKPGKWKEIDIQVAFTIVGVHSIGSWGYSTSPRVAMSCFVDSASSNADNPAQLSHDSAFIGRLRAKRPDRNNSVKH